MVILIVTFSLASLLLAGVAVPLILRRVPPNPWYGFRVAATLDHPALWYPANAYSGYLLAAAGIVLAVAALGLPLLPGMTETVYAISWTIALVGSLAMVLVLSWIYLRSLTG